MELLPLVCFCLLTCSGTTFGVEVTKITVKEDENVILPCSLDSTNIQSETFDWKKEAENNKDDQKNVFMYAQGTHSNNGREDQDPQFKGRVFHFEDQLQSGNASIVIRKTKVNDSGRYTCIFPLPQPGRTRSMIELIVDGILKDRTKENKPGAAPKPVITLHKSNEGVLLKCEVQGASPKPKVVWKDRAGNILPAEEPEVTENEGRYNINLKTTVTKTDNYSCVSTQEEIYHEVYTETHVLVPDKESKKGNTKLNLKQSTLAKLSLCQQVQPQAPILNNLQMEKKNLQHQKTTVDIIILSTLKRMIDLTFDYWVKLMVTDLCVSPLSASSENYFEFQ